MQSMHRKISIKICRPSTWEFDAPRKEIINGEETTDKPRK
jgi:hypothetical protein